MVSFIYATVIRDLFKRTVIVKDFPPTKSKAFTNAVKFYDMSIILKQPIYDLAALGLSLYTEDWCLRVFKTPHVPFLVLISDHVRNRIIREMPRYIKGSPSKNSAMWTRVCLALYQFDKATQKDLIASGVMVGNDTYLKEKLSKQMSSKHPLRLKMEDL